MSQLILSPHYLVVMDEAGTSAHEPFSVVCAVIVEEREKAPLARAAISELLRLHLPASLQSGYRLHAKDVENDKRLSTAQRRSLLEGVMALPRLFQMPLSISIVRRGNSTSQSAVNLRPEKFDHMMAFLTALHRADEVIRTIGDKFSTGRVVAEDVPEMKGLLMKAVRIGRATPLRLKPSFRILSKEELSHGVLLQDHVLRVARLHDDITFVKKGVDSLTEIADACAWALRRYVAGHREALLWGPAVLDKYLWDLDLFRTSPSSDGNEFWR